MKTSWSGGRFNGPRETHDVVQTVGLANGRPEIFEAYVPEVKRDDRRRSQRRSALLGSHERNCRNRPHERAVWASATCDVHALAWSTCASGAACDCEVGSVGAPVRASFDRRRSLIPQLTISASPAHDSGSK